MVDHLKIKILILQRGKTQREIARRLGVEPYTLSKTIRGKRKNPWLVKKLAKVLRVKPESLMRAA